jgi:hypothetical protein
MNKANPSIDDQMIDDLVTGQLSGEPYRKALLALDAEPSRWKDCALAFLTEQALQRDLSNLAQQANLGWEMAQGAVESTEAGEGNTPAPPSTQTTPFTTPAPRSSTLSPRLGSAWLSPHAISTAALLLVSFLIGWLGAELTSSGPAPYPTKVAARTDGIADAYATNERPSQPPAPAQSKWPSSSGSSTKGLDKDAIASLQYVLDQKDSFMPLDRTVPRELVDLQRAGKIKLDSFEGIVPVTREDGSVAVVPVQMFRVVPVTLAY